MNENGASTVVHNLDTSENFVVRIWERKKCVCTLCTILENQIMYLNERKQAYEPLNTQLYETVTNSI